MRSPNVISDDDLKSYAEAHLQYEINMLTMSVSILAYLGTHNNSSPIPWLINNGILNTFAMHARNLIDFLYSRSKGKDFSTDIIIQDYVTEEDISLYLKPITPLLEEALIKANKQVAHLSMDRINYERAGKEWKFIDVMGHIRAAFSSIALHIPATKMNPELREKLSATKVALPKVEIVEIISPSGNQTGISFALVERHESQPSNAISA
jgi:hypothetical protein